MRKIILFLLTILFSVNFACAESIDKMLTKTGVNKASLSIAIRDVKSGNVVYSLNSKTPMTPASTLKLLTTAAAIDTLEDDFKYVTTLYKSSNNDLYIKLSGDPLLTYGDLLKLVETARLKNIEPKNFYADETAFDSVEWGEGWQWDDELNPLMPKFSVYNLDDNLLRVEITPVAGNVAPKIAAKPFYPITFINLLKNDLNANDITIDKNNTMAANIYNLTGFVSKKSFVTFPIPNVKMNFMLRLKDAIRAKKLDFYDDIKIAKVPQSNVYVVDKVAHDVSPIVAGILKNSNNLYSETLFKTAGQVYSGSIGSRENSLKMLDGYFSKLGLNAEDIRIVDGSGVSKNNLMTANFMTEFLVYKLQQQNGNDYKEILPTAGEGTLKNRMLYFKDILYAKTGTLSDTSAIAGYITTKRGNEYAFDIMICDAKTSETEKKNIEENVLRNVFLNY